MKAQFSMAFEERVDIQAQKMGAGNRIRFHTDFGLKLQTHRLVIQLNRGWETSWGGLLILAKNPQLGEPSDMDRYYAPISALAVGFEISPRSFHAVSVMNKGTRYTLVYSFRAMGGYAHLGDEVPEHLRAGVYAG
jgi:Rps23 Pro-64 3,4-dihydroxylase Tpa1-like proline 4-hydroxylase